MCLIDGLSVYITAVFPTSHIVPISSEQYRFLGGRLYLIFMQIYFKWKNFDRVHIILIISSHNYKIK